jgi:hypothetical protein
MLWCVRQQRTMATTRYWLDVTCAVKQAHVVPARVRTFVLHPLNMLPQFRARGRATPECLREVECEERRARLLFEGEAQTEAECRHKVPTCSVSLQATAAGFGGRQDPHARWV